jgi:hypothetical protein
MSGSLWGGGRKVDMLIFASKLWTEPLKKSGITMPLTDSADEQWEIETMSRVGHTLTFPIQRTNDTTKFKRYEDTTRYHTRDTQRGAEYENRRRMNGLSRALRRDSLEGLMRRAAAP